MIAAENVEMMTADAVAKGTTADEAIMQVEAVEMTTLMMMDVTAGRISARNPDLNKDRLCSTRTWAVDVKNPRITVVTVNSNRN